jgi:hypothetical protein
MCTSSLTDPVGLEPGLSPAGVEEVAGDLQHSSDMEARRG